MTAIRTAFINGETWQGLIEEHPGWVIGQFADGTVVTIREVRWPSDTDYGDFDENGWLRLDPTDAVRA